MYITVNRSTYNDKGTVNAKVSAKKEAEYGNAGQQGQNYGRQMGISTTEEQEPQLPEEVEYKYMKPNTFTKINCFLS